MKIKSCLSKMGLSTVVLLVLFTLSRCSGKIEPWPQFRGINCSGIAATNSKPPVEFTEKNLVWKIDLPKGYSSPCVWGENLYLTGYLQDEKKLEILCINCKNGKIRWQHSLSVEKFEKVSSLGNPAQSSPVTDGKHVYFFFGSYGLLCYNPEGTLIWERKFPVVSSGYGSASSPILFNDMLILCRDVFGSGKLYAFDKADGDSLWVTDLPDKILDQFNRPSYSTPVIWKDLVVLHRMWQSTAHSIKDGSLKWWITMPTNGNSTPVYNGDMLYYGAWHEFSEEDQRGKIPDFITLTAEHDSDKDGLITMEEIPPDMILFTRPESTLQHPWYLRSFFNSFDINKDGYINKEEWIETNETMIPWYQNGGLLAVRPGSTGELASSDIIWKVNDKVPEVPSPLYYNNRVYMCSDGGILTCMNAENGEIIYRERINAPGSFIASPVEANGYIYLTSAKGVITVIKAADKLEIIKQSNLKENVFATPAIAGNSFYVRTESHLLAFK